MTLKDLDILPVSKELRVQEFTWKCKGPRIANTILKNNKVGRLTLPDFKTIQSYSNQSTVVLI